MLHLLISQCLDLRLLGLLGLHRLVRRHHLLLRHLTPRKGCCLLSELLLLLLTRQISKVLLRLGSLSDVSLRDLLKLEPLRVL